MLFIPLCKLVIYVTVMHTKKKLLLLLPEKGSGRESAQILSFTISHTQATTLGRHGKQDDRWGTTYNLGRISVLLFFYLFVFFQKALLHLARIGKVKAELCTHYRVRKG